MIAIDSRELCPFNCKCSEAANEMIELRAVLNAYLDFAQDVAISPGAPELAPIRNEMRRLMNR